MHTGSLTLRVATGDDAPALARLAELEEAQPLAGDVLLAELDGAVLAAVTLADGTAHADIFKPTAAIVRLLRDRRAQIAGARRFSYVHRPERPRGIRRVRGLWRAEAVA